MDQSDPNTDQRLEDYYARVEQIEAELWRRLEEAGISRDVTGVQSSDPRYAVFREAHEWASKQFNDLRHTVEEICDSPQPLLPAGWQGDPPTDRERNRLDVLTFEGLKRYVKDEIELFHSGIYERWPSGREDGLECSRQAISNAYRAARDQGLVIAIPSANELTDINIIENCWYELRMKIERDNSSDDRRPDVSKSLPPMTQEQDCVLSYMFDKHPKLCKLDDFESMELPLSRATASKVVSELIHLGYVHRPKGSRKGATAIAHDFRTVAGAG